MAGISEFIPELGVAEKLFGEITKSSQEVLEFAHASELAKISAESMLAAIQHGAGLDELSARTGESVSQLYGLEQALKAAGLSAELAGPLMIKLREALAQVNDPGAGGSDIFAQLGLSRAQLAGENPLAAIQQITAALHQMNPGEANGIAEGIFGQEQAGHILQMADSVEGVARAIAHSREEAALFATNARAFRQIGDTFTEIKGHIEGFWAGLASGLAPEIQKIETWINSIDFTRIGLGIVQVFKDGKVMEVVEQAFKGAFEKVDTIIVGTLGNSSFWAGIGRVMLASLESSFLEISTVTMATMNLVGALVTYLAEHFRETMGKAITDTALRLVKMIEPLAPFLGKGAELAIQTMQKDAQNYKAEDFETIYKRQEALTKSMLGAFAPGNLAGSIVHNSGMGIEDIAGAVTDASADSDGPEQEKFKAMIQGISAHIPAAAADETGRGNQLSSNRITGHAPSFTGFDKMNLVMDGGVANPLVEATQRQTQATDKLTQALLGVSNKLTGTLSLTGPTTNQL